MAITGFQRFDDRFLHFLPSRLSNSSASSYGVGCAATYPVKILLALVAAVVLYIALLKIGPWLSTPAKSPEPPAPTAQETPRPDRPLSPAEVSQKPGSALRRPITRTQETLEKVRQSRREDQ